MAGRTDCPVYAKAELLADRLQCCLPNFRVHKISILPDEWKVVVSLENLFKSRFVCLTKNQIKSLLVLCSNGWRPLARKMAGSTQIPLWSGGSWWIKVAKG